jgi:hypothetical protein
MRSTTWPGGADRGASTALRWAGGCLATATLLSIAGCVPSTPAPAATPSAKASAAAPVFASDEEALAAARSTYEQFVSTVDTVIAENGASPGRIDAFATPALAAEEKQGIQDFVAKGYTVTGRAVVTNAVFQSRSRTGELEGVVTLYVCMDVSGIEITDSAGTSAVEDTRPDLAALEVTFDAQADKPSELVVASKSAWNGGGVC